MSSQFLKRLRDIPLSTPCHMKKPLKKLSDTKLKQASNSHLIDVLHEYNGAVGYYLKIYFISNKRNRNFWKVTLSSISNGLKTGLEKRFFGKTAPIIVREDWEQAPKLGHPDQYVDDMVAEQEPDRKGDFVAVGVSNNGKTGWVIVKITDKQTEIDHRNGKLIFVSPSIESIRENAAGEDVTWRINHLAFVSDPAYGFEAQVTGSCTGTHGKCVLHLSKQASVYLKKLCDIPLRKLHDIKLKQATKDEEDWITVNGHHILIPEGEKKGDVLKTFFDNKDSLSKSNKSEQIMQKSKEIKEIYNTTEKDFSVMVDTAKNFASDNDLVSELYKKHNFDPNGFTFNDVLRGPFNHYTISPVSDNPEGVKNIWEDLTSRDPKIKTMYQSFLNNIDKTNNLSHEQFKTAPSFFRGTSRQELDSYLESKTTGADRAKDKYGVRYNFTAITPNEKMADIYNSGVTIEYTGDDVRDSGAEPVTYDPYFQKTGQGYETKKNGRMDANFMDQSEVRMDAVVPLDKLGIKSIKINSTDKRLIKKYSPLGKVILIGDEDD